MLADRLERMARGPEKRHRVGVRGRARRVAEQRLMRRRRRGVQAIGMGEPFLLREQVAVLAVSGRQPLDLTEPEPQRIGLHGALTRLRRDLLELTVHLMVQAVGALIFGEHHDKLGTRVTVQRLTLPARLEQLLLVGLAVHGNQIIGEVGKQADGNRAAPSERP